MTLLAIAVGASLGALARYGLGVLANPLCATMPLGTLLCNILGSYGAGLLAALCVAKPEWSALRPFVLTGFLGAFTTFSTFSLEVCALLSAGRVFAAFCVAGTHLVGACAATLAGYATVSFLR